MYKKYKYKNIQSIGIVKPYRLSEPMAFIA